MARGIIGRKLGMTQVFTEDGTRVACTVLEIGPCTVVQVKTADGKDGYNAVKLGYEEVPERKLTKPELGEFKARELAPQRILREFRLTDEEVKQFQVGQTLTSEFFKAGEFVDVIGTSKGRGFSGVIRRHHFRGGKRTHGVHEYYRHGGSIGCNTYPGRVVLGKKMPGQHGNTRVTVQNLRIVRVHPDLGLVLVRGAVPGAPQGLVLVSAAKRI